MKKLISSTIITFSLTTVAMYGQPSRSILFDTFQMHAQTSSSITHEQSSGSQQGAKVELTTDPSPARRGPNTFRVTLGDTSGNPILGAKVSVTLVMPAMPEMNMDSMKTVIAGIDKGGGMYEGKGDLGSGGIWQVTVTATQNGKTILQKQLTLKVAGGM